MRGILNKAQIFRKVFFYWKSNGLKALLKLLAIKGLEMVKDAIEGRQAELGTTENIIRKRFASLQPLPVFFVPNSAPRINLVTDSINSGSLFGGVGTAIIFSALLAEARHSALRIITRMEKAHAPNFREVLATNGIPWVRNVEFTSANILDPKAEVDVGDNDLFITTSWWTTLSVKKALGEKRIIYLLQEDERMFYPLGDDYLRCTEILKSDKMRFVINSELLYQHLISEGFNNIAQRGIWFEPSFHQASHFLEEGARNRSKKNFFFYARPNNPRNLFYLGLDVINQAISRNILNLDEWEIFFVGADVPDIKLGQAYSPRILQNLSWTAYTALVRQMDLGLCLMYTPHPSYPPIDLAACGAVVVTNQFGLKQNLDGYSKNILCRNPDADSLLDGIAEGISLSTNWGARIKNFQENNLRQNWAASFEKVIRQLTED